MMLPEPIYTYTLENGFWVVRAPGGFKCGFSLVMEENAQLTALLMDRFYTYRGQDFWTKEQAACHRDRYLLWLEMIIIMKERGIEV